MEENPEKQKGTMSNFFKRNWLLLGILLFTLITRLMYFNINSAIWYDEGEYFSMALRWAEDIPFRLGPQRLPFFPFLASILMNIGLNEAAIRFVLVALPSLGIVWLTYLLGKEMYNKNIGLIASFLMSVFWALLFNVARFHTDTLAFFFWLIATYFFWKGYVKKNSNKYIVLMGFFFGLGFVTRSATLQLFPIFLIYLLITERLKFLKNKYLWLSALVFILTILPYFIWAQAEYSQWNVFTYGYAEKAAEDAPFSWFYLRYIPLYLETIYFTIFIFSLLTLYRLFMGFDLILKNKAEEEKSDLFVVISILGILAFFILILKPEKLGDERWLFYMSWGLFIIIAKGLYSFYNFIKKYNKIVALILLIGLILAGGYEELKHAHATIIEKKDSYLQVKEAALWIKENTNPGDIVVSNSNTQMTYYAKREMIAFGEEEVVMKEVLNNQKVRYLVLSGFEQHPEWTNQAPTKYQELLTPVKVFFLDQNKEMPILVIFEVKR